MLSWKSYVLTFINLYESVDNRKLLIALTFYCFFFLLHYVEQKRFQNDKAINNSSVDMLQDQRWVSVPWKNLQVGDIVKVSVLRFCIYIFQQFVI